MHHGEPGQPQVPMSADLGLFPVPWQGGSMGKTCLSLRHCECVCAGCSPSRAGVHSLLSLQGSCASALQDGKNTLRTQEVTALAVVLHLGMEGQGHQQTFLVNLVS